MRAHSPRSITHYGPLRDSQRGHLRECKGAFARLEPSTGSIVGAVSRPSLLVPTYRHLISKLLLDGVVAPVPVATGLGARPPIKQRAVSEVSGYFNVCRPRNKALFVNDAPILSPQAASKHILASTYPRRGNISREMATNTMAFRGYARAEDWEPNRRTISRLYRDENRSLKEVMEIMSRNYHFHAT